MRTSRWRAEVSGALAIVALVGLLIAASETVVTVADVFVGMLFVYLATYLILSVLTYPGSRDEHLQAWRARDSRGTFVQRYVLGTAPGPGISLFIASAALIVAVAWVPVDDSALSHATRLLVALTMAAMAWTCVALSFAITFHADDLTENGAALGFPGEDGKHEQRWSDYVYFAVSVMSTFGTTDIDVTSSAMRKTVTINALTAFVFNTVIVATLVNALASL